MGSPVTSLDQYQFAFNGYVFGAGAGGVVVTNVDGLGGLPPFRIQDDNRGYIDGSFSGRDFLDGRTVGLDILVLSTDSNTAFENYQLLQYGLQPQQWGLYPNPATPSDKQLGVFQFKLTESTGLQRMYGRVRNIQTPITPEYSYGYIVARVELFFPDPRYYTDTAVTVTGSSVSITNYGWAATCPVVTLATPPSNFTLSDGTNTMVFTSVDTGKNLVIDTLSRIITQNGTPARNTMFGYTWLSVPAASTSLGVTKTWTLNTGSMSVTYRSAYV